MKLFLTVALSLTMIALIAHAQSYQGYPPPPPNYPPPAYAAPPPPPPTEIIPPTSGPVQYVPPPPAPPQYAPQQAVTPMQPRYQTQPQEPSSTPALQAQQQGNITFVSGGAGDEDRDALKQVENQYNLRLMFAARNGDFLADIAVTLSDTHGNAVLDTIAEGPIFYAHVPPGRYRLTVSDQGRAQSRDISIGNGPVRQNFYWANAG